MARFDNEFIQGMKDGTDIVRLIESYGTKLKPRGGGDEFIGLCPIHNDTSPSLVANRKKNVWNCLGACSKGGDPIEWVMHAEKVGFRHAVELLSNGAVGKHGSLGKAKNSRRLELPFQMTADDQQLLRQISDFYHSCLKQNSKALDYLQKRGFTNSEMIDQFKIGFCDRSLAMRLPISKTKSGNEIRGRLKDLGILSEYGHEVFRGCLTFPIHLAGNTAAGVGVGEIYGRRIDTPNRGVSCHHYLKGPHVGVFNLAALQACDEIILCESIIDALTFWNYGYRNVTTSYGINGFTDDLRNALIGGNIRRILLAYDCDDAGNKAADELAAQLLRDGFEVFRIRVTPAAKDINNYAKIAAKGETKNDSTENWLGLLIRNATWLGKGKAPELTTELPDIFNGKTKLPQSKPTVSKPAAAKEENSSDVQTDKPSSKATLPEAAESTSPSLAAANGSAASSLAAVAADESVAQPLASPVPKAPKEVDAEIKGNEIYIHIGNRTYRVRGLERNLAFDVLKLNVMVRRDELFYVDTFDLYAARARSVFVKEASRELGFEPDVMKRDLGKVLLKLEALQDQNIQDALAVEEEKIELTDKDKAAALELLKQPNLVDRILADFETCGVVGEETNKLVGYLAATSRKLAQPLAILIQSSSAAGKSALMEAVLAFMPYEDVIKYSAMTGQSLFYMGGMELKHRILSIAEEEGVEQAAYALKLLQSEGQLTIASTGKDPGTGRMETQEYHVEGPVMIFLTTTSDQTDPELKNRCVTLGVCEHACHTEAIHSQQRTRRTLGGRQIKHERNAIRTLHQNAQRLLRPLTVVNNFAEHLTFRSDKTKSRRAHDHYLTLIEAVTLLHQYQRKEGTFVNEAGETCTYIETTLEDIGLANRLADRFLERSFNELPERTQVLLEQLITGLRNLCEFQQIELWEQRFTRKDVRRWSTFGDTQLKEHLARLVDYEYLKIEAGGGKGRTLEYVLSYDPDSDTAMSITSGLMDVKQLKSQPKPAAKDNANDSKPVAAKEENPSAIPDNSPSSPANQADKAGEVGEKMEEVAPSKTEQNPQNTDSKSSSRENDENEQADAA